MFFQSSRQFQSDETEVVLQAPQLKPQAPSQNKGKGKSSYDKWSNEEQSFLVDLWAEKHDRLESKDARIAWQEICQEIEINFGTKKTVEKCQRKIKYLLDKYKDAKTWNKTQSGGQLRKSVFYDKIDRILGTRDVVTLKHVVEAGTCTDSPISNPTSQAPMTLLHLVVVLGLQAHSQAPEGQVEQVVVNHPTP